MKKCLNCGFAFVHGNHKQRSLPTGHVWSIDGRVLDVEICPRCGSDALRTVTV